MEAQNQTHHEKPCDCDAAAKGDVRVSSEASNNKGLSPELAAFVRLLAAYAVHDYVSSEASAKHGKEVKE